MAPEQRNIVPKFFVMANLLELTSINRRSQAVGHGRAVWYREKNSRHGTQQTTGIEKSTD